jgi:iron complex outermembrane receptor protein
MTFTGTSRWRLGCAALLATTSLPASAVAQTKVPTFRIAASGLDDALRTFARLSGKQILFRSQDVRGFHFQGMTDTDDAEAALAAILRGTGLIAERPSPNVIVIRSPLSGSASAPSPEDAMTADVVVTGTNIRGGETGGPVRVLRRHAMERSGKATIADLIAAQTANFGGAGNAVASLSGIDQASLNYSLAPAANLRGLGTDATLTLFDGRRVAGSGGRGDFTDLSAIPSLAVERVEILTDGASAVYGSDAVAGVVNLVLRHRFDGIDMRLRGSTGTRGDPWGALGSLAAGKTWTAGSIFMAYEFEHRGRLSSADRAYTATGDLRPFGGSDRRTYYAAPGNILTFNPATGSFASTYAIPALSRQPTLADVQLGQNYGNLYQDSDLSPRLDRHAVYARVEQTLSDGLNMFIEGRYAHRRFDYRSPASVTVFSVTPANPFYIPVAGRTSTLIGYSFLNDLGPARVGGQVSALGLTGGFTWRKGRWTLDADGSFARERSSDRTSNQLNSAALAEALGNTPDNPLTSYSAARDGYFNPYGSGASNSPAILAFIGSGFVRAARRSSLAEGSGKVEGPLLTLPAGDVRLAFGGSFRRETFESHSESLSSGLTPTETIGRPGSRDIKAEYAEVQVPLFGSGNARAWLHKLTLIAAVRHEQYSDFGQTTNPKFGIVYSPAQDVTLRASYGTSFRAPALTEVNDASRIVATALPNAIGVTIPVLFITGGNARLGPEKAETLSAGAVIEPSHVAGLCMEINVFRTRFDNRIAQPALEDFTRALSNPALATYVQLVSPSTNAGDLAAVTALLNQPGAVVGSTPATSYGAIVDGRFVNTSSLDVSGLDWDATLTRPLGAGRFDVGLSATWLFHYDQKLTPLSPTIKRLDTLGNPVDIRLRGTAGWSQGPWSTTFTGNFTDRYKDDVSAPARAIAAFFTLDAVFGVTPTSGRLKGFSLSLSVENLFDRDAPFVNRVNGLGFDAASASPLGRIVALELRRSL